MPPRDPRTPAERVIARLGPLPPDACWPWPGARQRDYGVISVPGRRTLRVHRIMFEHVHGPVPPDLHVLHRCGNARCCNPAHLYAGTHSQNMRDAWRDGVMHNPQTERNRTKTHCAHGHELAGDNLYHPPGKVERVCRECKRRQWREWYDRTRKRS